MFSFPASRRREGGARLPRGRGLSRGEFLYKEKDVVKKHKV